MNNQRGSASLMVILIAFTLMLFGIFALMSSYSEYKLSTKYANWVSEYYLLDQEAQNFLRTLDLTENEGKIIERTITCDDIETKHSLNVKVAVKGGQITVLSWRQNQNNFDLSETESLWDGGN